VPIKPTSRPLAAALLGLAAVALMGRLPAPGPIRAASPGPRLVVMVSVDQMRADYLSRFGPAFRGGLRRLLDEGAVFENGQYRHANTETGPGHSILLSGRHPRHSGIVANDWYDGALRRMVNVVEDPVQATVGGQGRAASPANFEGFTLGDVLKQASPASRVVAVSLKDRSAVLMGGRRADGAYWYETREGRFITSTYYMKELPGWLQAWNAQRLPDAPQARRWTRLLDDLALYEKLSGPDAVIGEWDGKDTVFPHAVRGTPPEPLYYDDLRRTPYADEMTLDVALRALAAHELGTRGATDLLAVGFSATDVIGHTYGPDSQELMDQLLRLDGVLGRFFGALDERVGAGHWVLALSADHGVMPLVEVARRQGKDARRVSPQVFHEAVRAALAKRHPGKEGLVAAFDGPNVYLDLDAVARQGLRREDVEDLLGKALLATGLLDGVYTHASFAREPQRGDEAWTLYRAAFYAPRSPHLMARVKPWIYVSDRPGGTGHGGPQEHDRRVPVAFLGAGVRAGRYPGQAGPEEIAPTLAALAGLTYPLQDAQRVLAEAVAAPR
jgi:predicted AlkP superfamily pyrophosphatase or phosphodiesterase